MSTAANVREEIRRRHLVWGWQAVPARKYALLVADYYTQVNPFVGNDTSRPNVDRFGRRLLAWVGDYFDPLATDLERAAVRERIEAATVRAGFGPRNPLHAYVDWPPKERDFVVGELLMTLTDPAGAVRDGQLIRALAWDEPGHDYTLLLEMMDCLWPASWNRAAPPWSPPREAVEWASRIHRERTFGDLPVLADLLEDNGCSDRPLLDHCRNHPRHHRGCEALDRILGIERPARGVERVGVGETIRLVGLSDGVEGREWSFNTPFEIGRSSAVQLALQVQGAELVSRRHAVCRKEGEWWLADLGSIYGTWLNGVRVGGEKAKALFGGDIIQCADIALRVDFSSPEV
ncbi:MAG: FHA domain-containing protein [Planctomycetia bacterium]|nr:FHA domain-containing protein [Planctomycetia bacterium]